MFDNLQIKFRKGKNGPEAELVNEFLNYYDKLFEKENLEYSILTEVYAEVGIPDILIVAWDKNLKDNWTPERNNLNRKDLKILHHISSSGKRGFKIDQITKQLGFERRIVKRSVENLKSANLIEFDIEKNTIRVSNLDEVFFIKKIISIEAKITNWKKAFYQASLNENFSSHSYVLLPNNTINNNVLSSIKGNLGLLSHIGDSAKFKRKAKKNKLPGSYFSWVINEYIGRENFSFN